MEVAVFADPRADDFPEDSQLWSWLIKDATGLDAELGGILRFFRGYGTKIEEAGPYKYVLRPRVTAPIQGVPKAWPSEAEYREEADKWLKPHKDKLALLLRNLAITKMRADGVRFKSVEPGHPRRPMSSRKSLSSQAS